MKKMERNRLSLAVANVLSASAAMSLAEPPACAQDQPSLPVAAVQKVQVTGSRIPLQTLESESPVQILTAQDLKYTGLTNISEILNQLPQVFGDYGQMLDNDATGTATVNLRHLGAARTLVLIDGRRLPAGDPRLWATDINAIPVPLIQRVDLLTGGASSVYGSDAVAGVVNFIMNDHFEGVQFDYNGNGYNHNQHNSVASVPAGQGYQVPGDVGLDGATQDFSIILGGNLAGGKGNAVAYFEYRHSEPVSQASRDFGACPLGSNSSGFTCAGSSTSYPGLFINANTGRNWTIADAAGNVRPYAPATDQFNFAPYYYYQAPDERYLANFFAHYDALPNMRMYTEFDFMDAKTDLQSSPSGSWTGEQFLLFDNNPLLSQSFKDAFGITPTTPAHVILGRRNVEGDARQDLPRHTDYRIVIGAKGGILDGKWDYDFWWQSGKVVYQDTFLHDFSRSRTARALNVVNGPNGQAVCASVLDGTDPNCVPWDIFHTGGVTQASVRYLDTPGFQNGETVQELVGLHLTSDLGTAYGLKLPQAESGIGVALGFERRIEKLNFQTDTGFSTYDLASLNGPVLPVSGQFTVNEAFAELRVPVLENHPWAQLFGVNGSYRYSTYSTNQTSNTYGVGAEWAPVKQARFRGTYQQAARVPNIIELFTPQGINFFDFTADPCGPSKTATASQCQLSGLPSNLYGSAQLDAPDGQGNLLQGGNPALAPEKARSYTLGIVLQPMPNLSATIDYWNIQVENVIGSIPPVLALNQCLFEGQFCGLIHRDKFGTLWFVGGGFVTATNLNLGSRKTDGVDITFNYTHATEKYGGIAVTLIGTYLRQFITETVPGLGSYNCAGLYGVVCGVPLPKWRNVLTGIWNTPWSWNAGIRWRYFDSVSIDASSSNPQLSGAFNPVDAKIGAQSYFDLFAQWNINKNLTVRGGVNNVFDHDPPVISSTIAGPPFGSGNTYPQIYDTLGRNFFVNVQAQF